ncbi:MAG: HAMP domain-containing protein [Anaerolineales bacterium]|nr:HAMP domain-containing protein [Anaerolineales bacterium]
MRSFRHSLWFRLTAAFLMVAAVGIVVVALLANRATASGFQFYVNQDRAAEWQGVVDDLAALYRRQGNWQGAAQLLQQTRPGRGQGQGSGGLVLLDGGGVEVAVVGGRGNRPTSAADADLSLPVLVDGVQAGTLLVNEPAGGGDRAGEQFLTRVNDALWLGGGLSVGVALLLGLLLAWGLTRPLTQLTQATRQMAGGNLETRVAVRGEGEIGELANSFNQMAGALAAAEQQRQQLLADVAHELRTPLSIMRGHLEAMLDGVFELSPDNLALVHEETLLLGRLVEDLRTLSLAESGALPLNRQPVNVGALVQQTAAAFAPLAEAEGVRLAAEVVGDLPPCQADGDRLQQVLGNLVSNALRHVVDGSGQPAVTLRAGRVPGGILVQVQDNGPGMSPEAAAHVFDRFWRAERSRARHTGGSGLGLAISRAIVEAHDGRIGVESAPGEGATFAFTLPV